MKKQELISLASSLSNSVKDAEKIYSFLLKHTEDYYLAADLTQDTLEEIIRIHDKFHVKSTPLIWHKWIAYHKCVSYFKKEKKLLADEKKTFYYRFEKPDPSIDYEALKFKITELIDSLPKEQRDVILLRYYDTLSMKDIASTQNTSSDIINTRLVYARQTLKEELRAYDKQNILKLNYNGIIPILLWFFREYRKANGQSLTKMSPFASAVTNMAKKISQKIFIKIVVTMLASLLLTSGITSATKQSNTSQDDFSNDSTQMPTDSQIAGSTEVPGTSQIFDTTQTPDTTQVPDTSEAPDTTQIPDTSEIPSPPQTPDTTQTPESSNTQNPSAPENSYPDASEIPAEKFPALILSASGNYYIVTGRGNATSTHITIPSKYNGIPVTEIADYAFQKEHRLFTITIPNSITHIGKSAFDESAIHEIVIPDSVNYIESNTFYNCIHLNKLTLSKNLTTIDSYAFYGCTNLETLNIPKSVTKIKQLAFGSCKNLNTIIVEAGNPVYHSTNNCIIETTSKTLILGSNTSIIPADRSVIEIYDHAFFSMGQLTSITIPEGVLSLGSQSFDSARNLKTIYLPSSLTEIKPNSFTNCENLFDIYYAGTVKQWENTFPNSSAFLPKKGACTIHCIDGVISYS